MVKIDNIDIATLGMLILRGGDYDLLSFPARKPVPTNDWFEEDGIEVDLSDVAFSEKEVALKCYLKGVSTSDFLIKLTALKNILIAPGMRSLLISTMNKTFSLRFKGFQDTQLSGGLVKSGSTSAKFAINFSMDDPLQIFSGSNVVPTGIAENSHVKINGYDLSRFNIIVRQVYNSTFQFLIKEGMSNTNEVISGKVVDTNFVSKLASKQISIACSMICPSLDNFYANYSALFNNIRLAEPLLVSFTGTNAHMSCYYSRMENFIKKRPFSSGRVFVEFTLVFTTIGNGMMI